MFHENKTTENRTDVTKVKGVEMIGHRDWIGMKEIQKWG